MIDSTTCLLHFIIYLNSKCCTDSTSETLVWIFPMQNIGSLCFSRTRAIHSLGLHCMSLVLHFCVMSNSMQISWVMWQNAIFSCLPPDYWFGPSKETLSFIKKISCKISVIHILLSCMCCRKSEIFQSLRFLHETLQHFQMECESKFHSTQRLVKQMARIVEILLGNYSKHIRSQSYGQQQRWVTPKMTWR